MKLYCGDCLEVMKEIPNKSIDMILCDLPYGTTDCRWDSIIPFEPLWEQYNRIIKNNGVVALFGSEPFASCLRMSNIKNYKYDWVWLKNTSGGFIHAKNKPLSFHENVLIFSKGSMGHKNLLGDKRMCYFPQGLIPINKIRKNGAKNVIGIRPSQHDNLISEYTNYPKDILKYDSDGKIHPTQKPVALLEYLIKTYTNEGETVLDNCMGSGSTGVACKNVGRDFIGIELDEKYFQIAKERIENA